MNITIIAKPQGITLDLNRFNLSEIVAAETVHIGSDTGRVWPWGRFAEDHTSALVPELMDRVNGNSRAMVIRLFHDEAPAETEEDSPAVAACYPERFGNGRKIASDDPNTYAVVLPSGIRVYGEFERLSSGILIAGQPLQAVRDVSFPDGGISL